MRRILVNGVIRLKLPASLPPLVVLIGLAAAIAFSFHPARAQTSSDPVLDNARKAAAEFTNSIPKFVVKRITTRYGAGSLPVLTLGAAATSTTCSPSDARKYPGICHSAAAESEHALDVVTTDVISENGQEVDTNIRIDGTPVTEKDLGKDGLWSEGEFAGFFQSILSPASAARFTRKRATTIIKRPSYRYDYAIDQPHSNWELFAVGTSEYSPAYGGVIWIDQETSRVLRVEMAARNLPSSSPMSRAEWNIDYDFVKIGDGTFLLPAHSEVRNCRRNMPVCDRNTTEFREYRKYSSDASITFGDTPK